MAGRKARGQRLLRIQLASKSLCFDSVQIISFDLILIGFDFELNLIFDFDFELILIFNFHLI